MLLIGAIAVLAPQAALAGGTDAGTGITNNVTLDYKIGTLTQTQLTTAATFTVDKKISFTVTASNKTTTPLLVTPNTTGSGNGTTETNVIAYTIANSGNASQNFRITPTDGGSTLTATPTYYYTTISSGACGIVNTGTATPITLPGTVSTVAKDNSVCLYSLINVPMAATDAQILDTQIAAVSVDGGGTALSNTGSAGTGTAVVIAMTGGTNSASDTGEYRVSGANITVTKTWSVVAAAPEANGQMMAIPGATIQYSITVTNNGTADASTVTISDLIPANMTYVGGSVSASGSSSAAFAGNTVTVVYATLQKLSAAPSNTYTFTFNATIN
jgi:uncharacterized repeat protein (TIGR01451 family)